MTAFILIHHHHRQCCWNQSRKYTKVNFQHLLARPNYCMHANLQTNILLSAKHVNKIWLNQLYFCIKIVLLLVCIAFKVMLTSAGMECAIKSEVIITIHNYLCNCSNVYFE